MNSYLLSLLKKETSYKIVLFNNLDKKAQTLSLYILFLFLTTCSNQKNILLGKSTINIIPKPNSIITGDGTFKLELINKISIENGSNSEKSIAHLFQNHLKPIKTLKIEQLKGETIGKIIISMNPNLNIPEEGYHLTIGNNQSIELKASSFGGLFYGFQSFRQLCDKNLDANIKPENLSIPKCVIEDSPVFGYRGMHLDVSRHFFDVEFIKTYLDMIALHKMNVFHWHLTDDNGWRIEIKKYPLLTKKSAWRIDRTNEPWKEQSPAKENEKPTYGGFYTQNEIREVIQYAADRNIMVIPEIEMPGHTSEVFAAYPELSCKGEFIDVNPGSYWPNVDIFCAGNDNVFVFLENVLDEVSELFPGPYIHIGGDEADKLNWANCTKCQNRIKTEELKNEHELQSWFIKKIEKFILKKNKKLVGWDEILEGGLAKTATVMSWRGMQGGIESAKSGHEVIMCPTSHCYFDYYQANPETSPEAIGGFTTLKKVYSFNPIPNELLENEKHLVLGAQGNLWTEYVQTPERAQYRVLPRMTALSEILWSGPGNNTYEDFYFRLKHLLKRFETLNWSYAPGSFVVSINPDHQSIDQKYKVNISSEKPGEKIRYTLDGTDPAQTSFIFKKPIVINKRTTIKAALFIDNVRAGKISDKTVFFSKAMGKNIFYNNIYSERYSGNGPLTLIDGMTGTIAHNDGYWQGWEKSNLDVIIDLQHNELISMVSIGFLESQKSWIFFPTLIKISFSNDRKLFSEESRIRIGDGYKNNTANRKLFKSKQLNISARYIKIQAINRETCPDWHPGFGGKAWIFSDEIIVE